MFAIGMIVAAEPAPKPAAVRPPASPRRSGNHLSAWPTIAPYTMPAPTPPITAARYSTGSDDATELSDQAIPTRNPPKIVIRPGPKRSIRYPSSGTSHVSTNTNVVKAI